MSELTKLVGGVELDIEYLDGTTGKVKVRHLPVRQMQKYLEFMNDEGTCIEVFCDRVKGWADTLTPDSYSAIADKGQELNLPLFQNWYRRLLARSEAINPGLIHKAQEKALAQINNQAGESASGT